MCIGGSPAYATPQRQAAAFQDAPPVVTGTQIGVENPKDTKKVTEELKIKRQKREGTYVDPAKEKSKSRLRNRYRRSRKGFSGNRNAARRRAKASAKSRMSSKSMSGGRVGGRV